MPHIPLSPQCLIPTMFLNDEVIKCFVIFYPIFLKFASNFDKILKKVMRQYPLIRTRRNEVLYLKKKLQDLDETKYLRKKINIERKILKIQKSIDSHNQDFERLYEKLQPLKYAVYFFVFAMIASAFFSLDYVVEMPENFNVWPLSLLQLKKVTVMQYILLSTFTIDDLIIAMCGNSVFW
ncbi:MAG: hypothetical protein MHMPM18_001645 [Marteilia pararefringens]